MQKRFSEEQIVAILREAERGDRSIGEVCRAHGISQNTFYRWRHHYGGMQLSGCPLGGSRGSRSWRRRMLA